MKKIKTKHILFASILLVILICIHRSDTLFGMLFGYTPWYFQTHISRASSKDEAHKLNVFIADYVPDKKVLFINGRKITLLNSFLIQYYNETDFIFFKKREKVDNHYEFRIIPQLTNGEIIEDPIHNGINVELSKEDEKKFATSIVGYTSIPLWGFSFNLNFVPDVINIIVYQEIEENKWKEYCKIKLVKK